MIVTAIEKEIMKNKKKQETLVDALKPLDGAKTLWEKKVTVQEESYHGRVTVGKPKESRH